MSRPLPFLESEQAPFGRAVSVARGDLTSSMVLFPTIRGAAQVALTFTDET